jgi:hypothetical protein
MGLFSPLPEATSLIPIPRGPQVAERFSASPISL